MVIRMIKEKIKLKKENKNKERQAIVLMKDYCEGRMTSNEFYELVIKNDVIRNIIIHDKKNSKDVNKSKEKILNKIDINKFVGRVNLFGLARIYFENRKIQLNFFNPDKKLFLFILSFCPYWCDFTWNDEYLEYFVKNIYNDEFDKKKGKQFIKDNFIYKKYKPRWIQSCEWPIRNNKPCKFLYQSGFPYRNDYIEYHFCDENNEEIVIEQYY